MNQFYSWSGYWDGYTEENRPKKEYLSPADTPHNLTGYFGIQFMKGDGPSVFGIKPLENFLMQYSLRLRSGYPYTPTIGGQALEPNTARRPIVFTVDAVLRKDFGIGNQIRASIIARVSNLLNRKNVLSVFSETGSPTDPNPGYSKTNYSTNWDHPWYWMQGRSVDIGFRLEF
jgi:hypothetical protein